MFTHYVKALVNYRKGELDNVNAKTEYPAKVKFFSDSGDSKHLDITSDEFEAMRTILLGERRADHSFRVTHERTGKVAYEGESYIEAANAQYSANVEETSERREPLFRLWLIDQDGIGVKVNTQVG